MLRPSMSDFREALESISKSPCSKHPGFSAALACIRCGTFICAFCASSSGGLCFRCLHAAPELATRRARLAASLVDGVALLLPSLLLGVLRCLALPDEAAMTAPAVYVPALLVLLVQASLIRGAGASLGKRLLGIRVVRRDGRPAEVWRIALLRNALPIALCGYCGWFSLVDALFIVGEDRRCLHDWLAGTRVVKAPRSPRSFAARLVTG
ncbi:RDD family protein [Myxococcus xanthus DZ2]|nr:RDD family protein [Myxococcus xanthus]QVW70653.1 RDD family protein [Myxococcus xanthus DZ2]UEO03220.1 RDD family protein [Myxococcus xanthus DZ2]